MPGSASHPNIIMLAAVARRLEPLLGEVAFVGGATVALYLTRPGIAPVRPTLDVDIIVEVASRVSYYTFAERLRVLGFHEDVEANVLCRWRMEDASVGNIIVDVMPTETSILGFTNRWYNVALETAEWTALEPELDIRLVTAPCFLATKCEAFLGRGRGDFLLSSDMDDIVTVLLGRREIVDEVKAADAPLRSYLATQFRQWLQDGDFIDAVSGHLEPGAVAQAHAASIIQRAEQLAALH
jgi:hypothetical protein